MTRDELIADQVATILVEQLCPKKGSVLLEESLRELGADDLDMVELVMRLEEKFKIHISDGEMDKLVTVSDLVKYVILKLYGDPKPTDICVICKNMCKGQRVHDTCERYTTQDSSEVTVRMEQVAFILTKNNYSIRIHVFPDKSMTVTTFCGHESFLFRKSLPGVVKTIGELLIKAAELVKVYDIPK